LSHRFTPDELWINLRIPPLSKPPPSEGVSTFLCVGVPEELAGLCPSSLEQADYVQYRYGALRF